MDSNQCIHEFVPSKAPGICFKCGRESNDYQYHPRPVAPSSVAPESGEELPDFDPTREERKKWNYWGEPLTTEMKLDVRERQLKDALELRTLGVAGVVRDSSAACGWRNRRAERAEAELATLKAQVLPQLKRDDQEYATSKRIREAEGK